jgi:hypothetical protein
MCDIPQVFAILAYEGREKEFYPWYALRCKLMGQDCYRIAYTYGVKGVEPGVFQIIDGLSGRDARIFMTMALSVLEGEPDLKAYIEALAINHLYLNHSFDGILLSGEMINSLSRRYGWRVVGALLGATGSSIDVSDCVKEPSLITWQAISGVYGGRVHVFEKG